jgi:hypothetical protein
MNREGFPFKAFYPHTLEDGYRERFVLLLPSVDGRSLPVMTMDAAAPSSVIVNMLDYERPLFTEDTLDGLDSKSMDWMAMCMAKIRGHET